jgi:membrane-associated protease RseP (regulator of RpoE activity)
MLVAIPVLLWGLAHSPVVPISPHGNLEGQCLLYLLLKRIALGPIPDGCDVALGPVAFAGWVGLLVTMLNLWPVGQLDGGHVAYALFGPRHARVSRLVRLSVLLLALCNLGGYFFALGRTLDAFWLGARTAGTWFVWFAVLSIMRRIGGEEHPPTEPGELSRGRRIVACVALALFVLLLMPTVFVDY